jgi:hypothetical protein
MWQATATAAVTAAAAAALTVSGGCNNKQTHDEASEAEMRVNAAIVQMHFDEQARAGAITGRTIYPYHFVADQTRLTPLGEEHVQTLALALAEEGGQPVRLNVRRGDASSELYDARIAALKDRFAAEGVEADRVVFADGLGGGKGMSTKEIADAERAAASTGRRSRGGDSASMGGPTGPGTGYSSNSQRQSER